MEAAEAAEALLAQCKAEHLRSIHEVWLEQGRPSADRAQEARTFVAACVVRRGGQVSPNQPSDRDISDLLEADDEETRLAAGRCIDERKAVFGF
jgi:hypothetical protein